MNEQEPGDPREQASEDAGEPRPEEAKGKSPRANRRRRHASNPTQHLERIAEVHYCRSDSEANQYLALGAEWDLQDIIPMRVETEDGGERDEVHFVVARWETERDRARLRDRDRPFMGRRKPGGFGKA